MTPSADALARFDPISLPELDAEVALRVRTDNKHVLAAPRVDELLARLAHTHRALEIDGVRAFSYDSVYFDTPDLLTVRAHTQRRRHRFKCRSRLYVDAGRCWFELKLKSARDQTVKHRMPYGRDDHGAITPDARAFLEHHLGDLPDLAAALRTTYTRITLTGPEERVTIDFDLSFGAARMRSQWVIVETKSARGAGIADRELRRLGSRPLSLSKYLLGAGMIHLPTPPADARRVARRFFAHHA